MRNIALANAPLSEGAPSPTHNLYSRFDVLVEAEKVRRIVLVLQRYQPLVVRYKGE